MEVGEGGVLIFLYYSLHHLENLQNLELNEKKNSSSISVQCFLWNELDNAVLEYNLESFARKETYFVVFGSS